MRVARGEREHEFKEEAGAEAIYFGQVTGMVLRQGFKRRDDGKGCRGAGALQEVGGFRVTGAWKGMWIIETIACMYT